MLRHVGFSCEVEWPWIGLDLTMRSDRPVVGIGRAGASLVAARPILEDGHAGRVRLEMYAGMGAEADARLAVTRSTVTRGRPATPRCRQARGALARDLPPMVQDGALAFVMAVASVASLVDLSPDEGRNRRVGLSLAVVGMGAVAWRRRTRWARWSSRPPRR